MHISVGVRCVVVVHWIWLRGWWRWWEESAKPNVGTCSEVLLLDLHMYYRNRHRWRNNHVVFELLFWLLLIFGVAGAMLWVMNDYIEHECGIFSGVGAG